MLEVASKVNQVYLSKFESQPILIHSPGRVNLIGEHTDYNDGFVLPAAIDKVIAVAIGKNDRNMIRAYSVDMDEYLEVDLSKELKSRPGEWISYVKGVVSELRKKGYEPGGFDMVFGGDIPIGAGLSSSAALEGGILKGLDALYDLGLNGELMAKIGQLTEHNHVGVRCGIMDQFINIHGKDKYVLRLDCRTLEYEYFPFDRKDIRIVLCNSKVSHNLASSEYNVRRAQCEEGVKVIKEHHPFVENLRDVSLDLLYSHQQEMDEVVFRRCKYVIEENQRVIDACHDLEKNDLVRFGLRMLESHRGLSKDYEVSCPELDTLVDIAKDLPGVLGCRMMGGGFGGCTINLVEKKQVKSFMRTVAKEYLERIGFETEIYVTKLGDGVRVG